MTDNEIRMRKQRIDGKETRQRLLDAASMVFAEKGFRETTNADICEQAKVNTASVNYHFGSKEELYVEAWKHSFDKSLKDHPPDGGVAPDAPAEEKLRGRILSFMQRVADPKTYELEIIHKEMACPTGLLQGVIHSSLDTLHEGFKSVVAELLGKDAAEQQILFCYMNVVDMCFGFVHQIHQNKMMKDSQVDRKIFPECDVEAFAEHVLRFCMAGIGSIRKENERKSASSKKHSKKNMNKTRNKS
ncbi:MAG: CerR family C-terminal domain-containing protein [Sedimentisphaerales bacterium]|nr:CerR family C-terminal domain-containing protein [Sedimentisphaerales bacterium]